jgi:hypothetical protein
MANITRNNDLGPSSSLVIMWGSGPLLTVSMANRLVLHTANVVHFHHKLRKSLEEFWTQPYCAKVGTIPPFLGVIA